MICPKLHELTGHTDWISTLVQHDTNVVFFFAKLGFPCIHFYRELKTWQKIDLTLKKFQRDDFETECGLQKFFIFFAFPYRRISVD